MSGMCNYAEAPIEPGECSSQRPSDLSGDFAMGESSFASANSRIQPSAAKFRHLGQGAIKPSWWDAFHANRIRRSFIRHQSMYRTEARFHLAFVHLAWLIAPKPFQGRPIP